METLATVTVAAYVLFLVAAITEQSGRF